MKLSQNYEAVGVIAVTVVTVIIWRILYNKFKAKNLPPMLPSLPLIGSVLFLPKFENLHTYFLGRYKINGEIFCFSKGFNRLAVVLNSRNAIREALVKNSFEFAGRPDQYINKMGLNPRPSGIIHPTYTERFKTIHQRALSILKDFGFGKGIMEKRIQVEVDTLMQDLKATKGQSFCPRHIIVCNVLSVITSIVFAKRFKYGDKRLNEIIDTIQDLFLHLQQLVTVDIFHSLALLPYYKRKFRETLKTQDKLMQFLDVEIKESLVEESEENLVKGLCSTDQLNLDNEELRFIVRDLFVAGSETTATTLQWALILLANNKHVLTRLQQELDDNTGRSGNVGLDDRKKLPFLEATILEIMRYKTIVPLAGPHETLADTTVAGYFIPKGTQIIPNLYAAHMNSESWTEPGVFNPERFLDNDGGVKNKEFVIPFSLGRRSCLGESLARQEIFLFLAAIVKHFDILPPEGSLTVEYDEIVGITNYPDNYKLRLIERNRSMIN